MKIWALWLCFVLPAMGNAQNPLSNDLIIQLKPETQFEVLNEQCGISTQKWNWVDRDFRIIEIHCTSVETANKLFLRIKQSGKCQFYQHANAIQSRSVIPNDKFFAQQKYLTLSRLPETWPYQRNGLNRKGDTLVVAIMDSGVDTLHPDLFANRWVNNLEIPANKIDDDTNGYVDDVLGWNGGDNNNKTYTSVTLDGHGTAVAGIIGADGNNSIGIAGINWKIKIMPVVCYAEKGASSDIGVIRSMVYVFKMKKLYLQSNGAKGANIVALNTSVGMDLALPEDAPIWCSMYDSLGMVGVFASSATTNNDIDVGDKGDIPSTCPSKFMVVVNSTDVNDARASSGFSSVFVDIAAMGSDVFSTTLVKNGGANGPYSNNSGTSFASPQVGATAALIYQHACFSFLELAKTKPDSAVNLLVSWMLTGTDKLAVLTSKCSSGGRLNAFKVWQQMDQWCTINDKVYSNIDLESQSWAVYPSPIAQGEMLHIAFNKQSKSGTCSIQSIQGKKIQSIQFQQLAELSLPTTSLSPGGYFVVLEIESQRLVRKLLIY